MGLNEPGYELERIRQRLIRSWIALGVVLVLFLVLVLWNASILSGTHRIRSHLTGVEAELDSLRGAQRRHLTETRATGTRVRQLDGIEGVIAGKAEATEVDRLERRVSRIAGATARLDSSLAAERAARIARDSTPR